MVRFFILSSRRHLNSMASPVNEAKQIQEKVPCPNSGMEWVPVWPRPM